MNYISPIPTKGKNYGRGFGSGSTRCFQSIEELVEDCYYDSVGLLQDEERKETVRVFSRCAKDMLCYENLAFLMELCKYECITGKCISDCCCTNDNSENVQKGPSLDRLMLLPSHGNKMLQLFETKSGSVKSEDLEPTSVFVSSIDDLGGFEHVGDKEETNNLMANESVCDDKGSYVSELLGEGDEYTPVVDADTINEHWHYILEKFIVNDSPQQVNISNRAYKQIMEENDRIVYCHNFHAFRAAKYEILRLLKENAYMQFLSNIRGVSSLSPYMQRLDDDASITSSPFNKARNTGGVSSRTSATSPPNTNLPSSYSSQQRIPYKSNKRRSNLYSTSPIDPSTSPSNFASSYISNILDQLKIGSASLKATSLKATSLKATSRNLLASFENIPKEDKLKEEKPKEEKPKEEKSKVSKLLKLKKN